MRMILTGGVGIRVHRRIPGVGSWIGCGVCGGIHGEGYGPFPWLGNAGRGISTRSARGGKGRRGANSRNQRRAGAPSRHSFQLLFHLFESSKIYTQIHNPAIPIQRMAAKVFLLQTKQASRIKKSRPNRSSAFHIKVDLARLLSISSFYLIISQSTHNATAQSFRKEKKSQLFCEQIIIPCKSTANDFPCGHFSKSPLLPPPSRLHRYHPFGSICCAHASPTSDTARPIFSHSRAKDCAASNAGVTSTI